MSRADSPKPRRIRRDGWTADRQLRFLQHVRMSRESAYRLRSRLKGQLFALAWDSVYDPPFSPPLRLEMDKRHIRPAALAAIASRRNGR